jgi:hypothetical protein
MMIDLVVVLLWEELEVALSIFTGNSNNKGLGPRELHLLDVMARGEKGVCSFWESELCGDRKLVLHCKLFHNGPV